MEKAQEEPGVNGAWNRLEVLSRVLVPQNKLVILPTCFEVWFKFVRL